MGTTTRGYPYPEPGDAPDVPTHVEALAEAVDTDMATMSPLTRRMGHNLLHNGAMQVHQRGTSSSSLGSGKPVTADRWLVYGDLATMTATMSVEADAPTGSGFRKSFKVLITNGDDPAAAESFAIGQRIEGQNLQSVKKGTASAQPLTLSFWTKSNKTGTYVVMLNDADNTRHVCATYTVASSGTWEQQTITFPADLTGAFDNDANGSLTVSFYLSAGTNFTSGTLATTWASNTTANSAVGQTNLASDTSNYWQVTGVQLEVGSAATGFEHKGYETELAECQRYYETGAYYWVGYGTSGSYVGGLAPFKVTKRAAPTVAQTDTYTVNVGTTPAAGDMAGTTGAGTASEFISNRTMSATGNGQYNETWTASADL